MTDVRMMDVLPTKRTSTRGWLAGAVVATGMLAWVAVVWAFTTSPDYEIYLGVVGISVTLGAAEVAHLAWRDWAHGERGLAVAATTAASFGSVLIGIAALGELGTQGFVALASGVGLLGMATAVGLFGVYRATGKSSASTLTAMIIMVGLAYFASVLWAAVP
jgi:hypothetical protein